VEGEGGGEDHQRQQPELTFAARYLANSLWIFGTTKTTKATAPSSNMATAPSSNTIQHHTGLVESALNH